MVPVEQMTRYRFPEPEDSEFGAWNTNHVDESYDPAFLDQFAEIIEETEPL